MRNVLKHLMNLIYTLLYFSIVGDIVTETVITDDKFGMSYDTRKGKTILRSTKYMHKTVYKRWFNFKTVQYTFLVEVYVMELGKEKLINCIPMPLLCNENFLDTTLPHRLAINQCIEDNLI